jgi:hypothetical protein
MRLTATESTKKRNYMSHIHTHSRKSLLAGLLVTALACLGLAACGSSSSSSTTSTTNAANTSSTSTGAGGAGTGPGARSGRFAAMRECLAKEGITLPARTPGQPRTPGAGGFLGGGGTGGPHLPKGVTRAQFEAAVKKCGGGRGFGGGRARLNSPAYRAALTAFATCMRQNGVALPAPNTSGTGPVFDTKGIDTTSAQFTAARTKCQSKLSGAFARPGGAGAGGSASGAAGAGAGGA